MADKTIPELYTDNPVLIDAGDITYVVENTGTTPAEGAFKLSQLMFNRYKISVTVSANDLVVALKHEDGNNASADRPLYFKIGDSLYSVTGALSVTLADGTNWMNLGSTTFGTIEQDLFVYLGYRTASTAIVIGVSRLPYATLYSDFSATNTDNKHGAFSTAPAATDNVINIGRFAATLSLTGTGHLWTVPTFTTANLINRPTFETRRLTFTSTTTAGAGTPTTLTTAAYYKVDGNQWYTVWDVTVTNKGTASGAMVFSSPFTFAIAASGSGREIAATGKGATTSAAASGSPSATLYDGTTLWVNGYRIILEIHGFMV